jgi:hypothetical protein
MEPVIEENYTFVSYLLALNITKSCYNKGFFTIQGFNRTDDALRRSEPGRKTATT